MSVTLAPAASTYTKHAAVSSPTASASLDQLEQEIVGVRNKSNQDVAHQALRELQKLADLLKRLHL